MSDFTKAILKTVSPLAIEAAVFPSQHAYSCEVWGCEPFTREKVASRYGEEAAVAWDDLQASARRFRHSVSKVMEDTDDE